LSLFFFFLHEALWCYYSFSFEISAFRYERAVICYGVIFVTSYYPFPSRKYCCRGWLAFAIILWPQFSTQSFVVLYLICSVCPTHYRTRDFFNNSNTNEDIATKLEQEYVRCVRNEKECVCSPLQISLLHPH
jgi:hypothetical protein